MMGLAEREAIASRLMTLGWKGDVPAAIVCAASTPVQWTWTGRLDLLAQAEPPEGLHGVIVVGEVIQVRDALSAASSGSGAATDEVRYGRNR